MNLACVIARTTASQTITRVYEKFLIYSFITFASLSPPRALLGRETRERHALGFEIARTIGAEPARGFLTYYAKFDVAQILDLCRRVGATRVDDRVADLVEFVNQLQGPHGLWEYTPHPRASCWVTFDLLRTLSRIDETVDWISLEPRTPFRPYPRRERRY